MNLGVEALYIYDDQNTPLLEHIYNGRPPSTQRLLSLFLEHPAPRPSLIYLSDAVPPTTVFHVVHVPLLFLCPSSKDVEPLAVLEFLHRVIDVFEDFLGAPLIAPKIENNFDIVAQLLGEMCDGGVVCNTEPNALRENVEVSGLIGKLLTQVGFPGSSPGPGPSNNLAISSKALSTLNSGPAIPWRKSNVRHTSNELYVDVLENLSVILAPSGRPISAIVAGSIAFTARISGVPDLLLTLSAPGGTSTAKSSGISRTMQLPVFHPCVRLARWKENPGELSFIPPDGRFVLAGYEVDLLPFSASVEKPSGQTEKLFVPASIDMRTGLGPNGCDFEVRLILNTKFPGTYSSTRPGLSTARSGTPTPSFSFGAASGGSSNAPSLERLSVTVPLPAGVRSVTDLRPSRGEANFNLRESTLTWKVPTKDGASVNGTAILSGTITGLPGADDEEIEDAVGTRVNPLLNHYDDNPAAVTEPCASATLGASNGVKPSGPAASTSTKRIRANEMLMPRSVAVSFAVRGWLPSGIKVDSLLVDQQRSRGLGDGVKPYKGVKYLTISKQGVERRV